MPVAQVSGLSGNISDLHYGDASFSVILNTNYIYLLGYFVVLRNVVVEWLTLLLRILEVPGSSLEPATEFYRSLPQSLQENAGIAP
jgi:hypothetical protein